MRVGLPGSVFQTGLPFRQESEGLKTPGYSKTVLRTGLQGRRGPVQYHKGHYVQIAAGMDGSAEACMRVGSPGSVFQTGSPFRQESEGLKTPDYWETVLRMGLQGRLRCRFLHRQM